jgi:chitinase
MKFKRFFIFAIMFGTCVFHQNPHAAGIQNSPYKIIATYNAAEQPDTGYGPDNIPWSKITHLMYSYASINLSDLTVTYPDTFWNALLYCNSLKLNYGVKLLISIGGPANSSVFAKVTADTASINKFAHNCINLLKTVKIDGVNISWNYPKDSLECESFVQLLKSLRRVADSVSLKTKNPILLTVSIPGMIDRLNGTSGKTDLSRTLTLVDWINIDSYDYHTAADSFTAHHAPLYANKLDKSSLSPINQAAMYNSDSVVHYLTLNCKIPSEKLTLGTAFYGRSWEKVEQGDKMYGLYQKGFFRDSTRGSKPFGLDDFYVLKAMQDSRPAYYHYDSIAQAPWLYDALNKLFHTYENERSVAAKCVYVIKNKLGGMCISNISGDAPLGGDLLTTIIQNSLNPRTFTLYNKKEMPAPVIPHTAEKQSYVFNLRGVRISKISAINLHSAVGTYIFYSNNYVQKMISIPPGRN